MRDKDELRKQIVAAARGYVGVKYSHQAFSAARMDCRGLPLRVGRTLNLLNESAEFRNYGQQPNPTRLKEQLAKHLVQVPIADMQDGDILLLRAPQHPQHLAVRASGGSGGETWPTIIHADNTVNRVIEHRLDPTAMHLIDSVWRYPELVDG